MNRILSSLVIMIVALCATACELPRTATLDSHRDQHLAYRVTQDTKGGKSDGKIEWRAKFSAYDDKCPAIGVHGPRMNEEIYDIECKIGQAAGQADSVEQAVAMIKQHFADYMANAKVLTTPQNAIR